MTNTITKGLAALVAAVSLATASPASAEEDERSDEPQGEQDNGLETLAEVPDTLSLDDIEVESYLPDGSFTLTSSEHEFCFNAKSFPTNEGKVIGYINITCPGESSSEDSIFGFYRGNKYLNSLLSEDHSKYRSYDTADIKRKVFGLDNTRRNSSSEVGKVGSFNRETHFLPHDSDELRKAFEVAQDISHYLSGGLTWEDIRKLIPEEDLKTILIEDFETSFIEDQRKQRLVNSRGYSHGVLGNDVWIPVESVPELESRTFGAFPSTSGINIERFEIMRDAGIPTARVFAILSDHYGFSLIGTDVDKDGNVDVLQMIGSNKGIDGSVNGVQIVPYPQLEINLYRGPELLETILADERGEEDHISFFNERYSNHTVVLGDSSYYTLPEDEIGVVYLSESDGDQLPRAVFVPQDSEKIKDMFEAADQFLIYSGVLSDDEIRKVRSDEIITKLLSNRDQEGNPTLSSEFQGPAYLRVIKFLNGTIEGTKYVVVEDSVDE